MNYIKILTITCLTYAGCIQAKIDTSAIDSTEPKDLVSAINTFYQSFKNKDTSIAKHFLFELENNKALYFQTWETRLRLHDGFTVLTSAASYESKPARMVIISPINTPQDTVTSTAWVDFWIEQSPGEWRVISSFYVKPKVEINKKDLLPLSISINN